MDQEPVVTNGVGIPSHSELLREGTAVGLRNELHPNWMMPGNEHPNTPAIFFVDFPKVGHKIDLFEPGPQANPIGPQHIQEQAV
jgi:hypothetical protein